MEKSILKISGSVDIKITPDSVLKKQTQWHFKACLVFLKTYIVQSKQADDAS